MGDPAQKRQARRELDAGRARGGAQSGWPGDGCRAGSRRRAAALLRRVADGTISGKIGKEVFDAMWSGEHGGDADAIIAAKGLQQISDAGAIDKIVDDVLAANAGIVAEFRAGKQKAFQSLVGKAMAVSRGKADPAQVNAALKRKLSD